MIKYHRDIEQRTEAWTNLRMGKLTASDMKLILTPTLKIADNYKTRQHVYEIAAQRVTQYVEPSYQSFDMLRGCEDEVDAQIAYNSTYAPVERCGFIENDEWGFTIGYSPDGLIGDDGLIEGKSRNQALQFQSIVECIARDKVPEEHVIQVQTGLLVSRRKWLDYISYCGGLYMATIRVFPDLEYQRAIIEAATAFEAKVQEKLGIWEKFVISKDARLIKTERRIVEDMHI
jgi:YqaJ-like viral recombinase domain